MPQTGSGIDKVNILSSRSLNALAIVQACKRGTHRSEFDDMNDSAWADPSNKTGHKCTVAMCLLVRIGAFDS